MEAVLRNRSSPREQSGPCPAVPGDLTHGCSGFRMENQDPLSPSTATQPGLESLVLLLPNPFPRTRVCSQRVPMLGTQLKQPQRGESQSRQMRLGRAAVAQGWFARRGHRIPVGHWHRCIEEWAFWLPHRKETFSKRRTPSPKEPWSTGWHHTHLFLVPCQPRCWRKLSEGARTQPTQNQVLCVRYPGTSPKNQ